MEGREKRKGKIGQEEGGEPKVWKQEEENSSHEK